MTLSQYGLAHNLFRLLDLTWANWAFTARNSIQDTGHLGRSVPRPCWPSATENRTKKTRTW